MLNYSQLSEDFSRLLNSFSNEEIERWVAIDADLQNEDLLNAGKKVEISYSGTHINRLRDDQKELIDINVDTGYPLAA